MFEVLKCLFMICRLGFICSYNVLVRCMVVCVCDVVYSVEWNW